MQVYSGSPSYVMSAFGRTNREIICERNQQPDIVQTLHLISGDTIQKKIVKWKPDASLPDEQLVERIFLTSLTRAPEAEERTRVLAAGQVRSNGGFSGSAVGDSELEGVSLQSLMTLYFLALLMAAASAGPPKGSVLAAGGGNLGPEVLNRFINLAGGPDAPIVFIPTALDPQPPNLAEANVLRKAGARNLTVLHTTDRGVADLDVRGAVAEGSWRLVRRWTPVAAGGRLLEDAHAAGAPCGAGPRRRDRRQFGWRHHPRLVPGARRALGNQIMMAHGVRAGLRIPARRCHRPAPAEKKARERSDWSYPGASGAARNRHR